MSRVHAAHGAPGRLLRITFGLALTSALGVVASARADAPTHPDLPATSTEPAKPGPLVAAGPGGTRLFYGYGADLLEWDGKAIVARTRMPARIVAVAARDAGTLTLTLAPKNDYGFVREKVEVPFPLDGPRPGRGFWSGGSFDAYLSLREARTVAFGLDLEQPLDEHRRDAVLAALAAREAIDHTNAFLPLFRGQVLARAGRRDEAQKAWDAAADLPGAPFNDLLRVATLLEEEGAKVAADRAFDRGLSALRAAGLRPERLQSQMAHQVLLGVPRKALLEALQLWDVERVDRIEERVFRLCPRVEGAPMAFRELAAWMTARGRGDLASKWAGRAAAAASSVTNAETPRILDRVLPTIAGMAVVAPLIALVVGLRRGSRPTDPRRRVAWDVLSMVMPLLATLALLGWSNARFQAVERRSMAPVALFDDGAGSPDVAAFVDQKLLPSAERDVLRAWISREAKAVREGRRDEQAPPDDSIVLAALDHGDYRAAVGDAFGKANGPGGKLIGLQHTLLAAAIAFVIGYVVGQRTPRAATVAARVIPGGAESLGPVGPLLGGLFLGAAFAFAGLDRMISSIAAPNHARFFGIESIATDALVVPSRTWAVVVVVGYAAVHLLGMRLDHARAARSDKP